MKIVLKRMSMLMIMLVLVCTNLFGCYFSLYPKEYVTIVADTNQYKSPYNSVSLVENIQKKLEVVKAFEVEGNLKDESKFSLRLIVNATLRNSYFSLDFNKKDDYDLKLNLRNQILYFKVPLRSMGIDSQLNLGIKESVDELIEYLPLFIKGLKFTMLESIDEQGFFDIFNQENYLQNFLDYLLNLGENSFTITNNEYIIKIKTDNNLKVIINKDFSLKAIESDDYSFQFKYPNVGEYVLEYPGEIVGIGYVTLKSIEDTLGESFEDLLS